MAGFANVSLIPAAELSAAQIAKIRNDALNYTLTVAAREMALSIDDLVARDIRPVEDLALYSVGTTAATINNWLFTTAASTTTGYVTITGAATMADSRYIAIYGVKDLRYSHGPTAVVAATLCNQGAWSVSFIKIDVGGGTRCEWDTSKMQGYTEVMAGFSPAPILIPQNAAYNIYLYKQLNIKLYK